MKNPVITDCKAIWAKLLLSNKGSVAIIFTYFIDYLIPIHLIIQLNEALLKQPAENQWFGRRRVGVFPDNCLDSWIWYY